MRQESAGASGLVHGPLCAPRLLRPAADDHVSGSVFEVLGMHHLVADGHSGGLVASLQELYEAAVDRREHARATTQEDIRSGTCSPD
jgi:hypothetical protein